MATYIINIENDNIEKIMQQLVGAISANKKEAEPAPQSDDIAPGGHLEKSPYKFSNSGEKFRKLTIEQVREIKLALIRGVKQSELVKKYGVCYGTIGQIAYGKSYRYVCVHGFDAWLKKKGHTKYLTNRM